MRPSVTESPTAMMKSRLPYAMPSNSTPITLPIIVPRAAEGLFRRHTRRYSKPGASAGRAGECRLARNASSLAGVLHVENLVEFDVGELAVLLLDSANVHRLHDVARFRVD